MYCTCRSQSFRLGPPSPAVPKHYSIDQPESDLETEEFDIALAGANHDQLDARKSIRISYYDAADPLENPRDALLDERFVSAYPRDDDDGYTVTVDVNHGDCFELDTKPGTWQFVGVHAHNPSLMLFVPADGDTRSTVQSRRYNRPYATYYRSDFSRKLAAAGTDREISRVSPTHSEFPSEHAVRNPTGPVETERAGILTRIVRSVTRFVG